MPDFDPGRSMMRLAWETVPGVRPPASAFDKFFRFRPGETLSNEPELIDLESIVGDGWEQEGLPSKIPSNGDTPFELDAEGHLPFLLNSMGAYSVTDLGGGVHVVRMAPNEPTPGPSTYALEVSRDDGSPQVFVGGKVSALQMTLAPRGVLQSTVTHVFERADYWADAEAVTDPAADASPPVLSGLPSFAQWQDDTDGDVYLQVSDVSGLPERVGVLAKVGAASAYGAFESQIAIGTRSNGRPRRSELFDSTTGGHLGGGLELTWLDATNVEVGDEHRIRRERGLWIPAYPDVLPFNEIHASLLLDGEDVELQQFQLTLTPPVAAQFHIGGRWTSQVRRRGVLTATLSLQREYVDTSLRRRLESGEPFGLRCRCRTGLEFAPGHEHELTIVCPRLKARGRTPVVNARDSMQESVEAKAHPDPGNVDGFVDAVTFLAKGSVADPEA